MNRKVHAGFGPADGGSTARKLMASTPSDWHLLFSDSKRRLWAWKRAIVDFLPRLRLTLHERSSTVYPVTNGVPFLGFVTYPTHRLLKRRNGIGFARRFRRQLRQLASGELDYADVEASLRGWLAHAAHGDTYGLRRTLVTEQIIPRRPS